MYPWEKGGHGLNSKNKNRIFRSGFTILEIVIACVLIAVAVVPIYRSLSITASQEIETTKLSIARKIVESLRQELIALPFKDIQDIFPSGSGEVFVDVGEVGIPETVRQFLDQQRKFKDFRLKMELRYTDSSESVVECRGAVEWTSGNINVIKKEEILFLLVKP